MIVHITMDSKNFEGQYFNAAHIEAIDDKEIHYSKYISIEDLIKLLSKSKYEEKNREYHIGTLPQYYFDGMINRDDDERLSGKIVLTIPKRKGTVQFETTSYEICFPAFLFCFSLWKGRINNTYVFALKGERWNRNSRLYNYPFGNVNTSDHRVCWGRNQLPVIDSLHQLDMVCSLFFDSSTNNDHYTQGVSTKWKYDNLRGVLERLKKKDSFPERILVPSQYSNIGTYLDSIFK